MTYMEIHTLARENGGITEVWLNPAETHCLAAAIENGLDQIRDDFDPIYLEAAQKVFAALLAQAKIDGRVQA